MRRNGPPSCHPDRKYHANGLCEMCYARSQREKHRERYRANTPSRQRKQRYGLSDEDFRILLDDQNGSCALCGASDKKLVVDHDHMTGRIRGLLCFRCNNALGGYEILVGNPRIKQYLDPSEDN